MAVSDRLLGFCGVVCVGLASTRPLTAASADTSATVFILDRGELRGYLVSKRRVQSSKKGRLAER